MFNINFLNAIALVLLFSVINYQSGLKTKTYLCFKARKLIYVGSTLPASTHSKCFYTWKFTNAEQERFKNVFKRKP